MSLQAEFRAYAVHHRRLNGLTVDDYLHHTATATARTLPTAMTRSVIEERPTNFREIDVFSRLMMDRIIFLGAAVESTIANVIIAQLLFLESVDARTDILMYVNSPGGSVYDGLGIYDTMQYVRPDVGTTCTGLAASMGAVLLAGGAAGKRAALPHARVMIHQPSGGAQGPSADIEISARQIVKMHQEINNILARHTGKTPEQIHADADRDHWLRADEARDYGLVDEVLTRG